MKLNFLYFSTFLLASALQASTSISNHQNPFDRVDDLPTKPFVSQEEAGEFCEYYNPFGDRNLYGDKTPDGRLKVLEERLNVRDDKINDLQLQLYTLTTEINDLGKKFENSEIDSNFLKRNKKYQEAIIALCDIYKVSDIGKELKEEEKKIKKQPKQSETLINCFALLGKVVKWERESQIVDLYPAFLSFRNAIKQKITEFSEQKGLIQDLEQAEKELRRSKTPLKGKHKLRKSQEEKLFEHNKLPSDGDELVLLQGSDFDKKEIKGKKNTNIKQRRSRTPTEKRSTMLKSKTDSTQQLPRQPILKKEKKKKLSRSGREGSIRAKETEEKIKPNERKKRTRSNPDEVFSDFKKKQQKKQGNRRSVTFMWEENNLVRQRSNSDLTRGVTDRSDDESNEEKIEKRPITQEDLKKIEKEIEKEKKAEIKEKIRKNKKEKNKVPISENLSTEGNNPSEESSQ